MQPAFISLSMRWCRLGLESAAFPRLHSVSRLSRPTVARRTFSLSTSVAKHGGTPQDDRIIFSGIQPTGVPHLGNYLGALRPWVELQRLEKPETQLIFSVVDLHSLTSKTQTPGERRRAKREAFASLLAVGLNPHRCTLFFQSDVHYHSELHWILSCDASMGFLSRMTQWKSKLGATTIEDMLQPSPNPKSEERLRLGLFSYPVLQAADILLYRATHVPIGEDQIQHLEFARSLATAFNATFGEGGSIGTDGRKQKGRMLLLPPQFLVSPAKRVMSLTEPMKKMSKSDPSVKSRILISDTSAEIEAKFKAALTDSLEGITYDKENRPGVSNLLEIISHLDGTNRTPTAVATDFDNLKTSGSIMRLLKARAAELVIAHFATVREKYLYYIDTIHSRDIDDFAEAGAEAALKRASPTMQIVRDAIGL